MDGFVSNGPLMSAQIACFHVGIYTVWLLLLASVVFWAFFPRFFPFAFWFQRMKAA